MKKRILTGDRPTGKLHLGHYVGTLANRVRLQDEYECFFIIADLHMLTTRTEKEKIKEVGRNVRELVLDYLSCGIDAEKSVIYRQSRVGEVTYLALLFSMLVTVPRLERVPTLKDVMRDLKIKQPSLGLLSYPVLQAADILMVRANLVPVGKDQESHIEVTREVAEKFNRLYGRVFPVPECLVGEVPSLPGLDGKTKMSKSLANCIFLSDNPAEVERKVMSMYTDPKRIHGDEPGRVEGNAVFIYHRAFNENKKEVEELEGRYRQGKVGDVEVKKRLIGAINKFLEPIRRRRQEFAGRPGLVEEIVEKGSRRAQREAAETLRLVRKAMGIE